MTNFSNWVLGFFTAVMGIGGLFVSSNAGHGLGYYGGLAVFLFAVLFVFFLIRTTLDHEEQGH
ncbi:MAG: hypothetical protein CFH41_02649 [Alphaproteobacteria bacterium MarineAlpha11_Bin1]|nr:MAG: hypothetical protein CFH41_02649 [Alphaproteobacteria bacterium MarineAlpha11_Bin1]|tara:strand:+ start:2210 stop:2398 length:189 start_codon:yes stop_codon:yes gene_type:complete